MPNASDAPRDVGTLGFHASSVSLAGGVAYVDTSSSSNSSLLAIDLVSGRRTTLASLRDVHFPTVLDDNGAYLSGHPGDSIYVNVVRGLPAGGKAQRIMSAPDVYSLHWVTDNCVLVSDVDGLVLMQRNGAGVWHARGVTRTRFVPAGIDGSDGDIVYATVSGGQETVWWLTVK